MVYLWETKWHVTHFSTIKIKIKIWEIRPRCRILFKSALHSYIIFEVLIFKSSLNTKGITKGEVEKCVIADHILIVKDIYYSLFDKVQLTEHCWKVKKLKEAAYKSLLNSQFSIDFSTMWFSLLTNMVLGMGMIYNKIYRQCWYSTYTEISSDSNRYFFYKKNKLMDIKKDSQNFNWYINSQIIFNKWNIKKKKSCMMH